VSPKERVVCYGMLAIVAVTALDGALDPDLGWHVRAGQQMVQTHRVIRADVFSWSMPGYPWVDHEWATDVAMALLYGVGGLPALGLVWALIILAIAIAVLGNRPGDVPAVTQAAVTLVAFVLVLPPILGVRPQMLSLLFLAILAGVVSRERAEAPGAARRLWLLPVLFCAWANLHGGFAAGLIYLALVWFGRAVGNWSARRRGLAPAAPCEGWRVRQLGWVILACIAATFVNAYGPGVYRELIQTAGDKLAMTRINEWQSPRAEVSFAGFWLVVILAPALARLSPRKVTLEELLLYAAFLALSLRAQRNVAVFIVVVTPLLAAHLASAFPRLWRELAAAPAWFGFGLLIVAVGLGAARLKATGACWTDEAAYGKAGKYPYLAVADVAQEPPDSRGMCMYSWGGYMLRRLPDRRVFIDGRMAIWKQGGKRDGYQVFADNDKLYYAQPGCVDLLRRYQFDWILLPDDAPLGEVLRASGGWRGQEYADKAVLWRPVASGV
jgi:hypothetical protein